MTTDTSTAQERLNAAVEAEDETYIQEFQQGGIASQNDQTPDADSSQGFIDGYAMAEEFKVSTNRNRLMFSPHPMGGIQVSLYGSDGSFNQARLELDAASVASVHLSALMTMMIQTAYMQAAQAAQQANSRIVIPGRQ